MKRLLVALCILILPTACGLAEDERDEDNKLIYINIPDGAFEKACLAACDLDANGRISRYEAQRVLDLPCADAGIRSMSGIDEFTNLRTLDCSGNEIGDLDLRRCVLLRRLNCSQNRLTNLSIRNLRSLVELRCAGNLLTTLDLSDNTVLSTIECGDNRQTVLDISFCAREIARLATRGNPQLEIVYVAALQRIQEQEIDAFTSIVLR